VNLRGALAAAALVVAHAAGAVEVGVVAIKPSAVDPGVHDFDEPSYAFVPADADPAGPLVLFLSGTGGRPRNLIPFLSTLAGTGTRALGLEYDDEPAVVQVCSKDPDPDCSEAFRAMRVDGGGDARAVRNPPAEAIVARLVAALRALAHEHPADGWDGYLDGAAPRWDRLVIGGLSQGAGMAAYIAKHHAIRRVVLFSSPWDFTGRDRRPAPWLYGPSATPMDRWFAEYHAKENTAALIERAYAALAIPADHVLVFDRDLVPDASRGPNPYHGSTVHDPGYAPQWRHLFGAD
jgi:hypothetical protein